MFILLIGEIPQKFQLQLILLDSQFQQGFLSLKGFSILNLIIDFDTFDLIQAQSPEARLLDIVLHLNCMILRRCRPRLTIIWRSDSVFSLVNEAYHYLCISGSLIDHLRGTALFCCYCLCLLHKTLREYRAQNLYSLFFLIFFLVQV